MRLRRVLALLLAVALASQLVISCSADSNEADSAPGNAQGGGPDITTLSIRAKDNAFDTKELTAPANTAVTLEFRNEDEGVLHNFSVYRTNRALEPILVGELFLGVDGREIDFHTPAPGQYYFRCDVQPDTMNGTLLVR